MNRRPDPRPTDLASIKKLLRAPIVTSFIGRESDSIREFVGIWYSKETRANLQNIQIR